MMAKKRILAGLVDASIVVGWVVIVLAVVVGVASGRGVLVDALYSLGWHAVTALVIVVPVAGAAGLAEASRWATPGKRLCGLCVVGQTRDIRVTAVRAIGRNALKYGVPLVLAHGAVLGFVGAGDDRRADVWILVVVTVVVLALYVAGLFWRSGLTMYDLISGLCVTACLGRRAVAASAWAPSRPDTRPRRALPGDDEEDRG